MSERAAILPGSELTPAAVERLWRAHRQGVDMSMLSERFGVSNKTISSIVLKRRALAEARGEPTELLSETWSPGRCGITGLIL